MVRNLVSLFSAVLLICQCFSTFVYADTHKPLTNQANSHLVWKATVGNSTLYLMGSIHFGLPSMYPLPDRIMKAFNSADTLMVEVDIREDASASAAPLIMEYGFYRDGSSLADRLSAAQYKRLEQTLTKLGIPIESILPQKPWLVVLGLTAYSVKTLGFSDQLGVDRYFLDRASNKTVVQLETLGKQIKLMDGFSDKEQVWMLDQSLDELDVASVELEKMLHSWKMGDAKAMLQQTAQEFQGEKIGNHVFQKIILDRNHSMNTTIENIASTKAGIYFIVVGAGHLVGPEGMPALLKATGHSVQRF
ncbi:MAG: TraB/GumN family protein [Pseudomonadales bacterium]|nr:TraB/GumN family protein [Pseudomonadales bacterium]